MDEIVHPKFLSANWWYHYKNVVFWFGSFVLSALMIIGYGTYQIVTNPNYDIRITIALSGKQLDSKAIIDNTPLVEALRDRLERIGPDLNGDGETRVELLLYTFDTTFMNMGDMAQNVGFYSELEGATTYLYVFDTAMFEKIAEQDHFESLWARYPDTAFSREYGAYFAETALASLWKDVLPPIDSNNFAYWDECEALYGDMMVVLRTIDDVNTEAQSAGAAFLDALVRSAPPASGFVHRFRCGDLL